MVSAKLKRAIAVAALGGATLGLGGTTAYVVSAQQTPTPTTQTTPGPNQGRQDEQARRDQFLSSLASKLNVTPDRLKQAIDQTRQELGIQGGPGGRRGGERGGFGMELNTAAQAMNLSADQLRQELPGKSLADVARAHNVDPNTVANALKDAATKRIDQAVTDGRIPADRAAQMKQDLSSRIDQMMTRQVPADATLRGDAKPRQGGDTTGQTNGPLRGEGRLRGGERF
jgi:transposase-like protein